MVPMSSQEDESPFECSLIEWPLIEWPLIEWRLIQGKAKAGKGTAISEVENMGLQQVPEKKPHILTLRKEFRAAA